ncbi:MAG: DUF935 family protein [Phycisphaerae bacterium]
MRTPGRLVNVLKALGSLLPAKRKRATTGGRVVRPWREDAIRAYPSVGLTPARALSFLQSADSGWPQLQFELFSEMLQKWPRLAAVEATRRLALTGLEWEIEPAATADSDGASSQRASDAAVYCRETLNRIAEFRAALDHLASALGFGVAVCELVWEAGRLQEVLPVPHSRLLADPDEPWRLRVRTEDEPSLGVPLDAHPLKWIVHQSRISPGRHFDGGLLRASVLLYLAQNLSLKDWLIHSQVAGMPLRVAQFEPGTPEADKQNLLKMLESLGTDSVAIFSKNVELKLLEAGRGGARTYQALQDYCNTEVTILWLGQHLTTDVRDSGSRAAAEIHDRVREDLLVDDISQEAFTLGRDLLRPLVHARFGANTPAPIFRRSLIQSIDSRTLADTLAVVVRDLGMAVPTRWVHRALGVPEARADEPTLRPGVRS